MITINPQAADVITIQISDADQITLNTTAIVLLDGGGSGGGDADTLQGENGAYYLSRANHTGSQAISTVTGLQTALDAKLDIADYNDRFLGLYASFFDLEAAHPTANAGDYAQVDLGIGSDVIVYAWDVSDEYWAAVGSSPIANTDALPEGSSNLYFTGQRVRDTPLTGLSTATATPITAADSVLSAAGKLQAQISAIGGGNSPYISGRYYSQAVTGQPIVAAISRANNILFLTPFLAGQSFSISQFGFTATQGAGGGTIKAAIYEVSAADLVRVTASLEIPADTVDRFFFDQAFSFQAGKLYFFGFKTSASRTFNAMAVNSVISIGSSNPAVASTLQVTFLQQSGVLYAADMPVTIAISATNEQTGSPIQVAFRAS